MHVLKPRFRSLAGAALLFATTMTAASALNAETDVTGDWELRMDRGGRETFATLSIARKADGSLTGKWGSTEISDVKLEGDKLTFVRTVRFGDQEFRMNYEGVVKEGATGGKVIEGKLTSDRGTFTANASRKKARNPALGSWEFKYTVADREIQATLAISEGPGGALEGKWTSNFGEHVVSNLKLQDGKLTFARKSKFGDRELESTYEGTLDKHELKGSIHSELGDLAANGRRVGADLAGKWELTTTTDRGPRTGNLTVFGDLSGRYELFGAEIPIRKIQLEGSQVSFAVETSFGDQTFTLDFKGKLDGKSLRGEITSPRGTREVTGKKLEEAEAAPSSPFVGTWEITRQSSQGQRMVKLTIRPDKTGIYSAGDATVAVTDLKLDGNNLSFKVTVKNGDRDVTTEFQGKLEGTTLKGEFTTPRGKREATGKKVTPGPVNL